MQTTRQLKLAMILLIASLQAMTQTFINENFNSGIPFTWTVITNGCHNNSGDSTIWTGTNNGWRGQGLTNFSLDTSEFAVVDSDLPGIYCGTDEQLISQVFNASSATSLTLEFDQYYKAYTNDYGNVDVFNGSSWVTVATFSSNIGAWQNPNHQIIDLTPYINSVMQIRFRYVANWDWFWAIDNVKVYQPSAFSVSINVTDIPCNGECNGSAMASPTGGLSPYTYLWDDTNTQTTQTATGLCAGTYHVTVVDNNGDSVVSTATVSEPPALVLSDSVNDVLCYGDSSGMASVMAAGGTAPYSYLWNTGNTSSAIYGLLSGTYYVTITDNNGCTAIDTIAIAEPAPINLNASSTDDNGNCDGSATVYASGGTSPYSYLWDANAGNQTNSTADSLCSGTYCVTVTDYNGCTKDTCIDVQLYTGGVYYSARNTFKLFPNPGKGIFRVVSDICCGEVRLSVVDTWGDVVYQKVLHQSTGDIQEEIALPELKNGLYLMQLSTFSKTIQTKLIIQK